MTSGFPVFARLARFVLARSGAVTLVVAILALVATGGLVRIELDFSSTSFFGGDDPELQDLAAFKARWGADDRDLMVLVSAPDAAGVLTIERLARVQRLANELAEHPDVVEVLALPTLPVEEGGRTLLEQARTIVDPWAARAARADLLGRADIVPLLVSADARHTAVVARLAHSTDDLLPTVTTVERLERIVATHARQSDLELQLAGLPAIRAAFFGLTIRDQMIFVPLMLMLVASVLWSTYRRIDCVLIPAIAAAVPLLSLLGIMGWTGEPIGLLNQAYLTLLPVLAIADTIHLIERTHEGLRAKVAPREAVRCAAQHVGWACLLTTLTTGLGFASLAVSPMPILRNFGLYAALGIALSYVTVLFLIPPLLAWTVRRRPMPRAIRAQGVLGLWCRHVIARRRWVIVATISITVFALLGAHELEIDNRLSDLLEPEHRVAQASSIVDAELGGTIALEVELENAVGDRDDPAVERAIDAFSDWARARPEVRTLVKATASTDKSVWTRLSLRTSDIGGAAFARLHSDVKAAIAEHVAGTPVTSKLTGTPAVAYRGINRMTDDLRRALFGVFAIVTVLIGVLLRSVRLAAMSILPNVLPLVVAYGLFGWTASHLDPLATVILTVGLGIAVDDTIHLLARYARERQAGHDACDAMGCALEATGRAVVITSVTLALGLAVNAGSSFPPLQMLGMLGSMVIASALIADLGLLPVLVSWSRPRSRRDPP